MLLVANLVNRKWCEKSWKWREPWHKGTQLKVLSESFPMNTNMVGFKRFLKLSALFAFGESSLSIERVNTLTDIFWPEKFFNFSFF